MNDTLEARTFILSRMERKAINFIIASINDKLENLSFVNNSAG